jgi:hypothetical protein
VQIRNAIRHRGTGIHGRRDRPARDRQGDGHRRGHGKAREDDERAVILCHNILFSVFSAYRIDLASSYQAVSTRICK